MAIIGFGRMGSVYTELFAADFDVSVVSSRDVAAEAAALGARQATDFAETVTRADYIVPTVPLAALSEVVGRIAPHVRPETVVFDATSVKVKALAILGSLGCRSFGTHVLSKAKMAICGPSDALVESVLRHRGITIEHMSAEEHDRRNAIIGIAQFIGIALGNECTASDRRILAESTSGQILLALMRHVATNVATTYSETQIDNQFTREQRVRLIEALRDYDQGLTAARFPINPGEFS